MGYTALSHRRGQGVPTMDSLYIARSHRRAHLQSSTTKMNECDTFHVIVNSYRCQSQGLFHSAAHDQYVSRLHVREGKPDDLARPGQHFPVASSLAATQLSLHDTSASYRGATKNHPHITDLRERLHLFSCEPG